MPVILLSDNGSSRADSTLQLRQLAMQLGKATGLAIHPVSLQHADRIEPVQLDGLPAQVFPSFMAQQLGAGEREFILLPLFFGNSKALTKFVPDEVETLNQQFGDFKLEIAQVVYPLPEGEPLLSEIIYDHIARTAEKSHLPLRNIVLVDHGSPVPRVTEVRKHLANSVQKRLPADVILEQAVMERREGPEYDFNGQLLENWLLDKAAAGESSALVIMMFFLPGRHAGEHGDVVEICNRVKQAYPDFTIEMSPLISQHTRFLNLLENRLKAQIQ